MTRKIYVLNRGYFDMKKGQRICSVWNVRVGGLSGCSAWEDPATCPTLFSPCRSKNFIVRLFWRDQWSYRPECLVQISIYLMPCGVRKMPYATRFLTSTIPQIWHCRFEICGPGSSVGIQLTTGWTVRDRIPVGTRFSACPDRPWCPPSFL